jgi:hypothetical protein
MDAINADADLDKSEANILRAMLKYANKETGECWPGVQTLAKDTRMSVRGVQGVLRRLETKGRLIVVYKSVGGVGRTTGRGIPNKWRLNLVAPGESCEPPPDIQRNSAGFPTDTTTPQQTTHNPAAGSTNPAGRSHNPAANNVEPRSGCGGRAIESAIHQPKEKAIEQPCWDGSLALGMDGKGSGQAKSATLWRELKACGVSGAFLEALASTALTPQDVRREWATIVNRADVANKPAMLVHRLKAKTGIEVSRNAGNPAAALISELTKRWDANAPARRARGAD